MGIAPSSRGTRTGHASEDVPTLKIHTLRALLAKSDVISVARSASLEQLRRLFVTSRVPVVAVIDQWMLWGTVTTIAVLQALGDDRQVAAADIMAPLGSTLSAESDVESAAMVMASEKLDHVVVLGTQGELVGIVTAADIARHHAVCAGFSRHGRAA